MTGFLPIVDRLRDAFNPVAVLFEGRCPVSAIMRSLKIENRAFAY